MTQLAKMLGKVLRLNVTGYMNIGGEEHYRLYKSSGVREGEAIKSKSLHREVVGFVFKRIWYYMFKEKWIFTAPLNFGQFYVCETVSKDGSYLDWSEKEEGKKLRRSFNYHTNGRKFFIKWSKTLCSVNRKTYYKFLPYRGSAEEFTGKRGLAKHIKDCANDPFTKDFRGHLM